MEVFVVDPETARNLLGIGLDRRVVEGHLQDGTHFPLQARVLVVALVLELVGDPKVVVLVGRDAEFVDQPLAGGLLLPLTRAGMGGDGAVPAGVPEALGRRALSEQDPPLAVEDERGERPVADALARVGVEAIDGALFPVVGVDGDEFLFGVGVAPIPGVALVLAHIRRLGGRDNGVFDAVVGPAREPPK